MAKYASLYTNQSISMVIIFYEKWEFEKSLKILCLISHSMLEEYECHFLQELIFELSFKVLGTNSYRNIWMYLDMTILLIYRLANFFNHILINEM